MIFYFWTYNGTQASPNMRRFTRSKALNRHDIRHVILNRKNKFSHVIR